MRRKREVDEEEWGWVDETNYNDVGFIDESPVGDNETFIEDKNSAFAIKRPFKFKRRDSTELNIFFPHYLGIVVIGLVFVVFALGIVGSFYTKVGSARLLSFGNWYTQKYLTPVSKIVPELETTIPNEINGLGSFSNNPAELQGEMGNIQQELDSLSLELNRLGPPKNYGLLQSELSSLDETELNVLGAYQTYIETGSQSNLTSLNNDANVMKQEGVVLGKLWDTYRKGD